MDSSPLKGETSSLRSHALRDGVGLASREGRGDTCGHHSPNELAVLSVRNGGDRESRPAEILGGPGAPYHGLWRRYREEQSPTQGSAFAKHYGGTRASGHLENETRE